MSTSVISVLAAQVAAELHIDTRLARAVVREFIFKSSRFLAENKQLTLDGLGTFRIVVRKRQGEARLRYGRRADGRYPKRRRVALTTTVHVSFTKSARLKKLVRDYMEADMAMDKYGVDENVNSEQLEKQAAKGCPECGSKVVKHGSVLMCPKCGTEPFESPQNSGRSG